QCRWAFLWKHQHDATIAGFERAFALNPNFVDNRVAPVLTYAGEPERAIEILHANMRLGPFQPAIISFGFLGLANSALRRYEDAVRLLRECASRLPNQQAPHLLLACAYAQLGQLDEARVEAAEVLPVNPDFTMERWKCTRIRRTPEHRLEGLPTAGL